MGGLRVLVAGDKSSAGKSTVSLGLLSALLEAGFPASELAYIKPATQCVSSTLTARFCESKGIAYEHIGPLVFYRGMTRGFLDKPDAAELSEAFVADCAAAVDRISQGKRLTLIDGVGYPSVGSIVGCSSADMAVACRAPVLIVGKSGVGDAIDSFNLCARFFEARRVPVLGVVFNKLPPKGFYGLAACEEYVRKYMRTSRPKQHVYGLLPASDLLAALAADEACGFAFTPPEERVLAGPLTADDEKAVALVSEMFAAHVDIKQLVADVEAATARPREWVREEALYPLD